MQKRSAARAGGYAARRIAEQRLLFHIIYFIYIHFSITISLLFVCGETMTSSHFRCHVILCIASAYGRMHYGRCFYLMLKRTLPTVSFPSINYFYYFHNRLTAVTFMRKGHIKFSFRTNNHISSHPVECSIKYVYIKQMVF